MKIGRAASSEDLVEHIYEAAVLPELWSPVLAALTELSDTAWSTLVAVRKSEARWVSSSPEAEEMVRGHFDNFSGNLRTARLLARPYPGFITDYDILSQQEIDEEPLYQGFLIPRGFGFGVGTSIAPAMGDVVALHCEGRFADGPIGRDVVKRLDCLRPHLARSAVLASRLAFERAQTAVDTLSVLGLCACALAESGTVLVANREWDQETGFWTTRGWDRLALLDRRADRALASALSASGFQAVARSIPLRGSGETPHAVLHLVPVRRAAHDLFGRASTIAFLTKASTVPTQATLLLQALFDLTPIESDLAASIAAGRTVEQVAASRDRGLETVRNQLKSVLAKTGCRRQADLARLLAQLIPPSVRN